MLPTLTVGLPTSVNLSLETPSQTNTGVCFDIILELKLSNETLEVWQDTSRSRSRKEPQSHSGDKLTTLSNLTPRAEWTTGRFGMTPAWFSFCDKTPTKQFREKGVSIEVTEQQKEVT